MVRVARTWLEGRRREDGKLDELVRECVERPGEAALLRILAWLLQQELLRPTGQREA
jgi:hypothetical protein